MASSSRNARFLRAGFTLIEVLTAVLLIDIGLLALVAGSAVLTRQTNAQRARASALRIAANRVEELGALGCAAVTGELPLMRGGREAWSVVLLANATREVRDSVFFVASGTTHSVLVRTRIPC